MQSDNVEIECIANSDTTKGPEVLVYECPCAACTKLDYQVSVIYDDPSRPELDDGEITLAAFRHDMFPELWNVNGKAIAR